MTAASAMFDAILFDLDGTLIDTAPEIGEALNLSLVQLGISRADPCKVRSWIGHGTLNLITEALADRQGPDGSIRPEIVLPLYARNYRSLIGRLSRPYPGVKETLAALGARGIPMAVVSNKEAEFGRGLLRAHRIDSAFSVEIFGDTLKAKKPSPIPARHCMQKLMSVPPRTLLVGDSETDVKTARNADMAVWVVSYGYRKAAHARELGADRVIDSLLDVLPVMRSRVPIWSDRACAGPD